MGEEIAVLLTCDFFLTKRERTGLKHIFVSIIDPNRIKFKIKIFKPRYPLDRWAIVGPKSIEIKYRGFIIMRIDCINT
jgi:hypothetical protein